MDKLLGVFSPSLDSILSSLSSTISKLERFTDKKVAEVAKHLNEVERLNTLVSSKSEERDRAYRIAGKLRDLLK